MKRKLYILFSLLIPVLCLLAVPACEADAEGSVKELTKPYIAQYECVEAKLGDTDLLEEYDYIRIVLADSEKMQLVIQPKNGERQIIEGTYELDFDTRELTGEVGILGCRFKEKTTINRGEFTISKTLLSKQLFIKFKII